MEPDSKDKPQFLGVVLIQIPLVAGGVAKLAGVSDTSRIQALVGLIVALISFGMYFLRRQNRYAGSYLFISSAWLLLAGFILWPSQ